MFIKGIREAMIRFGYAAQNQMYKIGKSLHLIQNQVAHPPATVHKPPVRTQIINFINKPMPGNLPKRTSRALLDIVGRAASKLARAFLGQGRDLELPEVRYETAGALRVSSHVADGDVCRHRPRDTGHLAL